MKAAIDRFPRFASIIGAKSPCRRDRNIDAFRIVWIENNRMQAHATRAWLPFGSRAMSAQPGKLLPCMSTIGRAEQTSAFDSRISGVRIVQWRLEVADAFEFPGVLRAVVPLMRREGLAGFGSCVIDELVALTFGKTLRTHGHSPAGRLPGLPAIVRALNHLPEPGAGLRCVQPVRIRG